MFYFNVLKSRHTYCFPCTQYLIKSVDVSGHRFGRLTAIDRTGNKAGDKYLWRCQCDCGNTSIVSLSNLTKGITRSCGCLRKEMAHERNQVMIGEHHPGWNPNLTDEEREHNRDKRENDWWRIAVYERDNYTCQVCGKNKNFVAHHLNSWDIFPEQRYDIDNGICLCVDCHKQFHGECGYGNNTKEQFNEWLSSPPQAFT